jgi:hypothetical protein
MMAEVSSYDLSAIGGSLHTHNSGAMMYSFITAALVGISAQRFAHDAS